MNNLRAARDLVFVHIPKTGGTSLRKSLVSSGLWANNLLDYGNEASETSAEIRESMYADPQVDLKTALRSDGNTFIAGHFAADKYASQLPQAELVTFLRYPVNQVLSHFRHHVARLGFNGGLSAFCRNPAFCNLQTRYLNGVRLDRFSFVGILECLSLDVLTLSDIVGVDLPVFHLNRLEVLPSIPITQKQIAMIEESNADDMALYAAALALRAHRRTGA